MPYPPELPFLRPSLTPSSSPTRSSLSIIAPRSRVGARARALMVALLAGVSSVGAGAMLSAAHQAPAFADQAGNGGVNSVAAYGDAPRAGSAGSSLAPSVVGMAPTPTGKGYWTAAADGTVASFGDAPSLGNATNPRAAIVGMAASPSGHGYWLVASDGGVFSFGDGHYFGSTGGQRLNQPIVGMAASPSGNGYWLVATDGGIFTFGDAHYLGSTGSMHLAQPVVGMAASPSGNGYWLVATDGGIFTFGDAPYLGSEGGQSLRSPVVGMTAAHDGRGYWLATADGGVFTFGSAPFHGALGTDPQAAPAVAVAATPTSRGYWLATGRPKRTPLGTFSATCYSDSGTTASGAPTSSDVVAVDPNVIPLGTRLWIDGIGARTARDTGGAIQGDRIDIWEPSYNDCVQFGRQNVQVYVQQ